MLYKDVLNNWLVERKIFLKYSTYTNYYNIIHNHIMPYLGDYNIRSLNNNILQHFILQQLENGRADNQGGISYKYAKDIITVLKLTLDFQIQIQLPYHPPKQIQIFDKEHQITLINHLHIITFNHILLSIFGVEPLNLCGSSPEENCNVWL